MINPNDTYISLSRSAGVLLRRLGVATESDSADVLKRYIVGAASAGDIQPVPESKEMHFLAKAKLRGVECYLICVTSAGSPAGNKKYTTIIKGVMLPEDGKYLLSLNKGLAPIARTIANQRWDHEVDDV